MGGNGPCAHLGHLEDGVGVQQLVVRVGGVGISSNIDSRRLAEAPAARAARARSRSARSVGALRGPARRTSAMAGGKVGVFFSKHEAEITRQKHH